MAEREADLYAALDAMGIAHRTEEHEAVFTVAESAPVKARLPGGHSKTLLVTDKERLYLLVALGSLRVDLKGAGRALDARGRLSFVKPEQLLAVLGVTPGSVTPFALINDEDGRIAEVVLDTNLMAHDPVWFHPLRNTASTALSPGDLERFCARYARSVRRLDLGSPEGDG